MPVFRSKQFLKFTIACLFLLVLGCAKTVQHSDVVALRLQLNQGIGKVTGLDSILCRHTFGTAGIVQFDEMTWAPLSQETRKKTAECLDIKKKLRIRAIDPQLGRVRVWTARIDEDAHRLTIGWLYSDCPACDPEERVAEYTIAWKDNAYLAQEIPPEQQWK